jgi:hypothetical protein
MRSEFANGTQIKVQDHIKKYYDCRTRSARKNSSEIGFFSIEIQKDDSDQYQTNTNLAHSDLNGLPLDMAGIEAFGTKGDLPESLIRIRSHKSGLVIEHSFAADYSLETDLVPVKKGSVLKGLYNYRVVSYSVCTKSQYLDRLTLQEWVFTQGRDMLTMKSLDNLGKIKQQTRKSSFLRILSAIFLL